MCVCYLGIRYTLLGRSSVRIVTSSRAGMGKSLYIKRLREALETQTCYPVEVVIPVHGPTVTADSVVETLMEHVGNTSATIFHLDIAPNVCSTKERDLWSTSLDASI